MPKEHFTLIDASIMIRSVIKLMKIDHLCAIDIGPHMTLRDMIDSEGWLPHIMRRSDEIHLIFTEHPMWDVIYEQDSDTAEGIIVKDIVDGGKANQWIDESELMPRPMRIIILAQAIRDVILLDDKGNCRVKPLDSYNFLEDNTQLMHIQPDFLYLIEVTKILTEAAKGLPENRLKLNPDRF